MTKAATRRSTASVYIMRFMAGASLQTDTAAVYAATLSIYYEMHGRGEPLILLPGGFMTAAADAHRVS